MLELIREMSLTWHRGELYVFEVYVLFVWAMMTPRMLLAWRFYRLRKAGRIQDYPANEFPVSALVTVFREEPQDLRRCLATLRNSLLYGSREHELIVFVDGVPEGERTQQVDIAREYADLVLVGNYRNKRKNLRELVRVARHEILVLVDSDTFFNPDTIHELCRPFADGRTGGVTTAQAIHNPETLIQKMSFWFENARLYSSMAAAGLYRQVSCLPGRAYAVRKSVIAPRMDDLVNETFLGRSCVAGDDRVISGFILEAGYDTLLAPDARVTTLSPRDLARTSRMWIRWGRSSQRYTLTSSWLFRYPVAAFINWSDMLIMLGTIFIVVIHWPYMLLNGHAGQTLTEMVIFPFIGMMMTMSIRQIAHLWQYPGYWLYLPLFVLTATYLQVLRFYALLTMARVNTWGTRPGADVTGSDYQPRTLQPPQYTRRDISPTIELERVANG